MGCSLLVFCIWCLLFVTSQFDVIFMFANNVLAKFVDIIFIFHKTHSLYFMHHCTEYKLSALQSRISEETTINAMTQQFITAKVSGCTLKKGSKIHSALRQRNIQLQNQAAPMPCRLQALEHRVCGRTGWLARPPVCKIESC